MARRNDITNIRQAFFRYELWEDFQSGMYNTRNEESAIQKAIECLSNKEICFSCMKKVVTDWEIATAQVLTNPESNGRAWLGQCACYMHAGCHDEETRRAWVRLTEETRKAANDIADRVIYDWLKEYAKRCPDYQMTLFDLGVIE